MKQYQGVLSLAVSFLVGATAFPGDASAQAVTRLVAEPAVIEVTVGQTVSVEIRAYGPDGSLVDAPLRVAGARGGLAIADGRVTGLTAGEHSIFVSTVPAAGTEPVTLEIPVQVGWPPVTRVEVVADPARLFVGARLEHEVVAFHADGSQRPYPEPSWRSSDPSVASVDAFGNVRGVGPGSATITGEVEGVTATISHTVMESPVARIELSGGQERVRTGDVQTFADDGRHAGGTRRRLGRPRSRLLRPHGLAGGGGGGGFGTTL